jgi:hypothetical protein
MQQAPETFERRVERYVDAFGEPPLQLAGIEDEHLETLMGEALERGTPIEEDDYYREVPPDAVV